MPESSAIAENGFMVVTWAAALAASFIGGVLGGFAGLIPLGPFFWVYFDAVLVFSFFGGALFGVPSGLAAWQGVNLGYARRLCVAWAVGFVVVALVALVAFRPVIEGIGC